MHKWFAALSPSRGWAALAEEGLFAAERKKPLPYLPEVFSIPTHEIIDADAGRAPVGRANVHPSRLRLCMPLSVALPSVAGVGQPVKAAPGLGLDS